MSKERPLQCQHHLKSASCHLCLPLPVQVLIRASVRAGIRRHITHLELYVGLQLSALELQEGSSLKFCTVNMKS
jgi:hypothetical protein